MTLPSRELLSKVLDVDVGRIDYAGTTWVLYDKVKYRKGNTDLTSWIYGYTQINIHELAHLCKEWAFDNMYTIASCKRTNHANSKFFESWIMSFTYQTETNEHYYSEHLGYFAGKNEPEAIFKACEWILKRLKDKQ